MLSVEDQVHSGEIKEHAGITDQHKVGRFPSSPTTHGAGVQVGGIDYPNNKAPNFLCIPTPWPPPRLVSPNRTPNNGKGPEHKPDGVGTETQSFELERFRQ